jgi:hypothetical protein
MTGMLSVLPPVGAALVLAVAAAAAVRRLILAGRVGAADE